MRHAEAIALQQRLVRQFRQPLEVELPGEMRAYMTPELIELARRSDAYQQRAREYQRMATALESSDVWHVSAEICALVREATVSLPPHAMFRDTLVPAPFGLLVFDEVVRFPRISVGAFAWRIQTPAETERLGRDGIMTCTVHDHRDDARTEVGPIPYGLALEQAPGQAVIRLLDAWRLVYTTFAFIEQRILDTELVAEPVRNRSTLRRLSAGANRKLPAIRVVRLYPREREEPSGQRRSVAWSHQWLVRGHWRQQYYRSDGTHRPLWIAPYVKGPSDKPLLVRPTVVDVS